MRVVLGISIAAIPIVAALAVISSAIGVGEMAKIVAISLGATVMIVGGIYLAITKP